MALLETKGLIAHYGDFQALFGVDIRLEQGETLAIIGANGAGKTTLMRSITGVLRNAPGQITHKGVQIGHLPADTIMKRGLAMVPEGRRLFPSLSVEENLIIGGQHKGGRDLGDRIDGFLSRFTGGPNPMELAAGHDGKGHWTLETVYDLFPILRERRYSPGTALSGGQQQMVAIGRALMSNPDVLLCDEISLGLAPVVIRDILDHSLEFFREKLRGRGIVIERDYAIVPPVLGDRDRLEQVFLNLIVNAADAMPQGGTLTVRLAPAGDGLIEIRVSDTGIGIEPDVLGRIFEPFYTTKERGKGTGLGLLVGKRIIQDHGGRIAVESELDVGTTFRIALPTSESRAGRPARRPAGGT